MLAQAWSKVRHRRALLFDIAVLSILGFIHVATWIDVDVTSTTHDVEQTATRIRETASGGIGVAGFLIPLTIIAVQIRASTPSTCSHSIASSVLIDLLVANFWLVGSLTLGLYLQYFSAYRGYEEDILDYRHVGILFGFQLFLLMIGVVRLVAGLAGLGVRLLTVEHTSRDERRGRTWIRDAI